MLNYKDYLANEPDFKGTRLVLVEGGIDQATGINWCPDCIDAEENVKTILIPTAKAHNIPLDIVEVGQQLEWKDPNHPLRLHKVLKVPRIPTLFLVKNEKVVRSLIELDIVNKELLHAFLEDL